MKVEYTEDGSLDYNSKNLEKLKRGIVIFPETKKEAKLIKNLKKNLKRILNVDIQRD